MPTESPSVNDNKTTLLKKIVTNTAQTADAAHPGTGSYPSVNDTRRALLAKWVNNTAATSS